MADETITFRAVGPISEGVLTEEQAEELRQRLADRGCDVYWGGHACSLKSGHDGWHVCQDEDEDEPHHTVSPEGVDDRGREWDLHGSDAPWESD